MSETREANLPRNFHGRLIMGHPRKGSFHQDEGARDRNVDGLASCKVRGIEAECDG
jgi:hypothetical protein